MFSFHFSANRRLLRFLSAVVAFALLSSVAFVVFSTGHSCLGECCPYCHQISTCNALLHTMLHAICTLLIAACAACLMRGLPFSSPLAFQSPSLIALKVKLSD